MHSTCLNKWRKTKTIEARASTSYNISATTTLKLNGSKRNEVKQFRCIFDRQCSTQSTSAQQQRRQRRRTAYLISPYWVERERDEVLLICAVNSVKYLLALFLYDFVSTLTLTTESE